METARSAASSDDRIIGATLALAVDALLQAKTLEILLVHFAPVQPLDLGGEFLDFPFDMGRDIQCFCIHVQPLAL